MPSTHRTPSTRSRQRLDQPGGQAASSTFVIGLDYDVKGEVPWQSAVVGVLDDIYSPFKVHQSRRVRSAGGSVDMAFPLIVRLNYWVDIPFHRAPDLHTKAARAEILKRDGHTCAYCAGWANTIDHIWPASRGGESTWGNLVAACAACNGRKDNQTPEQAGMKLLWDPRASTSEYVGVQAEVWRILQAQ